MPDVATAVLTKPPAQAAAAAKDFRYEEAVPAEIGVTQETVSGRQKQPPIRAQG